jgi:hypothetical protein
MEPNVLKTEIWIVLKNWVERRHFVLRCLTCFRHQRHVGAYGVDANRKLTHLSP